MVFTVITPIIHNISNFILYFIVNFIYVEFGFGINLSVFFPKVTLMIHYLIYFKVYKLISLHANVFIKYHFLVLLTNCGFSTNSCLVFVCYEVFCYVKSFDDFYFDVTLFRIK